ncbi:MAG: hypothetical protein M3Q10_06095, partial [Chloroflexota bacterium]|nr:hypothetical protein [Chloroflexota bacterium]
MSDDLTYRIGDDGAVTFAATSHVYRVRRSKRGRPAVTLECDGSILAGDRIDLHADKDRRRFAGALNGKAEAVGRELVVLASLLADDADETDDDSRASSGERAPSQATALVALAVEAGVELFHDPNSEPFATFDAGGHRETAPIRAGAFRQWLAKRFYDRHAAAPGSQAVQDALSVLGGKAAFEGPTLPVWVRLAEHDGRLYLDLADDQWRAVEIGLDGWRIVGSREVPVKFRRPGGMLALPEPDCAGSLAELGRFANVADPDDLVIVVGWLVGAFALRGGRAVLEVVGEQGSAKSTLARVLRRIVDPCTVPLRTAPRDERDLVIAAANGLVVGYDNLSDVKDWLSDAFCRLSTGGGISSRKLYTDLDEALLDAQRPCLVTGINPVATRSDLIDRTLSVTLPPIPPEARRTEAEVWADFEEAHPRLLGGVLRAVAAALANRGRVDLPRKPRLADFVAFVEAAAPALGWEPGDVLAAFEASRRDADAVAVEALPIGPAVLALMKDRAEWRGTATALLADLADLVDDETRKDRDWPKRGNRLSGQLRRLAPNLRQLGVLVGWERGGHAATREILMHKNSDAFDRRDRQHRHRSAEPPDPESVAALFADDADDADDGF